MLFLPSIVDEVWFEDSFGRPSAVAAANTSLRGSEVSVDRFLRRARLRFVDVTNRMTTGSRLRRYHRPRVSDTAQETGLNGFDIRREQWGSMVMAANTSFCWRLNEMFVGLRGGALWKGVKVGGQSPPMTCSENSPRDGIEWA